MNPVGLDIETTTLRPHTSKVCLVQLDTGDDVTVVDALEVDPVPLLEALREVPTPAHNAKFEWQHIKHAYGVELDALKDTMLMEQVLDAGDRHPSYKLEHAVERHLGQELDKDQQTSDWSQRPLDPAQLDYAAADARVALELYRVLLDRLQAEGLEHIADLENRVLPFTALMELTGVLFDNERWDRLTETAARERDEIEEEMRAIAPPRPDEIGEWNLNSPKDVRRLLEAVGIEDAPDTSRKTIQKLSGEHAAIMHLALYKEAKAAKDAEGMERAVKQVHRTAPKKVTAAQAWNFSSPQQIHEIARLLGFTLKDTSSSTLSWYVGKHRFFELLVRYRQKVKLVSTYGADWGKEGIEDGRVYSNYHQLGADSGRFSSSEPNMQNVPRVGGYRECFVAPPGHKFVVADYSQIELRVLANQTGDDALLWAFRTGHDSHKVTAMKMAGKKSVEEVTKEERSRAKIVNYGISYGITEFGLPNAAMKHYGVPMTVDEAADYIEAYFKVHPKIKEFQQSIEREIDAVTAMGRGLNCYTPMGRRRKNVQNKREAFNHPVQGGAGDGIKEAMARLYERRQEHPDAKPWASLHDSIAYVCPEDQAEDVEEWLVTIMVEAMHDVVNESEAGHEVPIEVDSYVDTKWRSES